MYSPRALFSRLFLQSAVLFFLFIGLLWVGYIYPPLRKNIQSPVIRFAEIWPLEVLKMAAGRHLGFDPTGNGAVRTCLVILGMLAILHIVVLGAIV